MNGLRAWFGSATHRGAHRSGPGRPSYSEGRTNVSRGRGGPNLPATMGQPEGARRQLAARPTGYGHRVSPLMHHNPYRRPGQGWFG